MPRRVPALIKLCACTIPILGSPATAWALSAQPAGQPAAQPETQPQDQPSSTPTPAPTPTAPATPSASTPPASNPPASNPPARGEDPLAESAPVDMGLPRTGTMTEFTLSGDRDWATTVVPPAGSDAAVLARAKRLLAENKPRAAQAVLDAWLDVNENTDKPEVAEAFLRRGDAKFAARDEYEALYDYERVIKDFPGTPEFVIAVEREMEIAILYLNGLRRKFWGLRLDNATGIGEELLMRVQERMPGSQIAERAGIELADYYYRTRELKLASDAYDIFSRNFPKSEYRQKAMQRRVFANIARFKGPAYDSTGLREAQFLIRDYAARYPEQAEQIGMNDALIARLEDGAASQMLTTAEWYIRTEDMVSARFTLKRLLRKHPTTIAARRAMEIFTREGWELPKAPQTGPMPLPEPEIEGVIPSANAVPSPNTAAPADAASSQPSPTGPAEAAP